MQIKDLSIDEFKALIRETVEETLQDWIVDPDAGKPIKAVLQQQLLSLKARRATDPQTLSAEQVMEELGLI
ncbi:hypothetical protein L3556_11550 [Candidatus Synechococcus calcipolaris G9]|uniref:Addiction module component n=1 Tax=Candidatus Synechococcus calcipolaris G9 TaxID=1497997 RepID=A0ABT6F147_9SYNE|nr:hypothetical protein [Candidatus Synechococcus calcipolaris]MDG2991559.1 hypothetical protein [Candidatus Synechococcus calcipolaris G9]